MAFNKTPSGPKSRYIPVISDIDIHHIDIPMGETDRQISQSVNALKETLDDLFVGHHSRFVPWTMVGINEVEG
jgi:hypothetical protein